MLRPEAQAIVINQKKLASSIERMHRAVVVLNDAELDIVNTFHKSRILTKPTDERTTLETKTAQMVDEAAIELRVARAAIRRCSKAMERYATENEVTWRQLIRYETR